MKKIALRLTRPFRVLQRITKYWILRLGKNPTLQEICDSHFRSWSTEEHINRSGLTLGITALSVQNPVIFETGTSAYGVDSSRLFDRIVTKFSGKFISVDINPQPKRALAFQHSKRTKFFVEDSVTFIRNTLPKEVDHIDLCYLDSWDVDWSNPLPSAEHGLNEFEAVKKFLKPGSILIIDDTPSSIEFIPEPYKKVVLDFEKEFGVLPGKGAFIYKSLQADGFATLLSHQYNLVLKVN